MARIWVAREYMVTDTAIEPTGRRMEYMAETREDAVAMCLYAHQIADGRARLGPTGMVVHAGRHAYAIVEGETGSRAGGRRPSERGRRG